MLCCLHSCLPCAPQNSSQVPPVQPIHPIQGTNTQILNCCTLLLLERESWKHLQSYLSTDVPAVAVLCPILSRQVQWCCLLMVCKTSGCQMTQELMDFFFKLCNGTLNRTSTKKIQYIMSQFSLLYAANPPPTFPPGTSYSILSEMKNLAQIPQTYKD